MKRVAALVLLLAACAAPAARADGDPASDYLYTQKVFVPFDVKASQAKQAALLETVEGATKQGFTIRIAIIASPYDLGAVPSLWAKPATYARFLGAELAFLYRQRLLIVMPNGFGFFWKGHPTGAEDAALQKVKIRPGPGLVDSAQSAVLALAAASGVHVVAANAPRSTTNRDRLIVLLAAIVLIALAVLARLVLRRRRRE